MIRIILFYYISILILFAAGHETTSNALTFTCELLARNPEAQVKILEEIQKVKAESEDIMHWIKNASERTPKYWLKP